MAKCVRHIPSGGIARLPDDVAYVLVHESGSPSKYTYTTKGAFKKSIRDKNSKTIKVPLGTGPAAE